MCEAVTLFTPGLYLRRLGLVLCGRSRKANHRIIAFNCHLVRVSLVLKVAYTEIFVSEILVWIERIRCPEYDYWSCRSFVPVDVYKLRYVRQNTLNALGDASFYSAIRQK